MTVRPFPRARTIDSDVADLLLHGLEAAAIEARTVRGPPPDCQQEGIRAHRLLDGGGANRIRCGTSRARHAHASRRALRRRASKEAVMAVTVPRNTGMLLLGIWLVLSGLSGLVSLGLPYPLMAV